MQDFPSSQLIGVPLHMPSVHTSPTVQALASVQGVPLVTGGYQQPEAGLQEFCVHSLPSSQLLSVPVHNPLLQVSFSVQALPSAHSLALQSASAQSISASQSLSMPSLQTSDDGVPGIALHTVPVPSAEHT